MSWCTCCLGSLGWSVWSALCYSAFFLSEWHNDCKMQLGNRSPATAGLHLPIAPLCRSFFDTTKTGEITSRLSADTTTVSDQICLNLNVMLRSATQVRGWRGGEWLVRRVELWAPPPSGAAAHVCVMYWKLCASAQVAQQSGALGT